MGTKICKVLTYGEAKPIMGLHGSDHAITRSHVSNWILPSPLLQDLYHQTWVVSYGDRKSTMESHDSLTMQSCMVT